MCQSIYLLNEEEAIETVAELAEKFGSDMPIRWRDGHDRPDLRLPRDQLDFCLCGLDMATTAYLNGYRADQSEDDPMHYLWMKTPHKAETFRDALVSLPSDYTPFGKLERWENPEIDYPDCSCGCAHYHKLEGDANYDYGVCTNPASHRCGLLTFEHQGCLKFTKVKP